MTDDRANICVDACRNIPTAALADPLFSTLLQTLAQYGILKEKPGMEGTGYALGSLLGRAFEARESTIDVAIRALRESPPPPSLVRTPALSAEQPLTDYDDEHGILSGGGGPW